MNLKEALESAGFKPQRRKLLPLSYFGKTMRNRMVDAVIHTVILSERKCNKIRYETPVAATKAAYHMEEVKPSETFDVYRCWECDAYHIGHS